MNKNIIKAMLPVLFISNILFAETSICGLLGILAGEDVTCQYAYKGFPFSTGIVYGVNIGHIQKKIGYDFSFAYSSMDKTSFLDPPSISKGFEGRIVINYYFTCYSNPNLNLLFSIGPILIIKKEYVNWACDNSIGALFFEGAKITKLKANDNIDEIGGGLQPSLCVNISKYKFAVSFNLYYINPVRYSRSYSLIENANIENVPNPRGGITFGVDFNFGRIL